MIGFLSQRCGPKENLFELGSLHKQLYLFIGSPETYGYYFPPKFNVFFDIPPFPDTSLNSSLFLLELTGESFVEYHKNIWL